MSHSYARLYYHLVWATARRQPFLVAEIEADVHRFIRDKCREVRAGVLAVNGTENHVHLLVRLPTSVAVDLVMQRVKGASSRFITQQFGVENFRWQGGYGAFTLHPTLIPRVQAYIDGQKEHHRAGRLIDSLEYCTEEEWQETALSESADLRQPDTPAHSQEPNAVASPRSGLLVPSPEFTRGRPDGRPGMAAESEAAEGVQPDRRHL